MTTPSTVYDVPSATTPGRTYRVTVFTDGVVMCDCPDATYRRRQCKHCRLIIATKTAPAVVAPSHVRAA